jgi:hypothetical protein
MTRILHFVPAYNKQVCADIVPQAQRDMLAVLKAGHDYAFQANHSCDLVLLRNQALHKAVIEGHDFLYMQDADVFSNCPTGPLIRLLGTAKETGACVTGALVSTRGKTPIANASPVDGGPVPVGTVFEASKLGTGMVLIDMAQVRQWYGTKYTGACFDVVYDSYQDETGHTNHPKIHKTIGMDILFTKYLVRERMGQTVYCDARIPTTHVDGTYRLDYDGKSIPDELAGNRLTNANGSEAQIAAGD